MLSAMTATEIAYWIAFYEIEPYTSTIPGFDSWLHAGISCSTLANIFSKKKTFKPQDFMPRESKREPETQESIDLKLKVIFGRRLKKD